MTIKKQWRRWLFRRRINGIKAWSYAKSAQIAATGYTRCQAIKLSDAETPAKKLAIGKLHLNTAQAIADALNHGITEIEQIINGRSWWRL